MGIFACASYRPRWRTVISLELVIFFGARGRNMAFLLSGAKAGTMAITPVLRVNVCAKPA